MEIKESEISVEEMQELLNKIDEFYRVRGYPKQNAIWLADLIIKRLQADYDLYINTTGERGKGKSNLTLLLALLQCRYAGLWRNKETGDIRMVLPRTRPLPAPWVQETVDFSFDRNLSFLDSSKEVRDKFNSLRKYSPFVIDEGSKNLHKQNWMQKTQFMLVQLSDTERYQNKSFYICFPNFREVNSVFRNDRIRMNLYVYDRGNVIISMKDTNRYADDPWHLDANNKIINYHLRHTNIVSRTPKSILKAEMKTLNFAGHFEFPSLKDFAPRIWEVYMNYKIRNAQRESNSDIDAEKIPVQITKWRTATKALMKYIKENHPEVDFGKFAEITQVNKKNISDLWKSDLLEDNSPVPLVKAPR